MLILFMVSKEKCGKLIRTGRKSKGLTMKQLAAKIGTSQQQIQNYENGDNYPSVETLDKLIKILGLPSHRFFDDKETVDIIDKLGKKFGKYNNILSVIEKDREFESFAIYYSKNKEKLKDIKFIALLKKLAKLSPAERKRVFKFMA